MKKLLTLLLFSAAAMFGQQQLYSVKLPQVFTYSTGKPQYIDRFVNPTSGSQGIFGVGTDTVPIFWTLGSGLSVSNGALIASGGSAGTITVTDDTTTNATMYPVWVTANTGNLPIKVASTKMTFNPSTGALTATTFNLGTTTPGVISGTSGAITLTGAGSNQNITLTPSGTGLVSVVGAGVRLDATAKSLAAWGVSGPGYSTSGRTYTDTSSSGTVATAVANSFAVPTFAASSATVFTNAANVYIAGDVANGTNVTNTNSWGFWNVGKTRLDGRVEIGGQSFDSSVLGVNYNGNLSGGTTRFGFAFQGTAQSGVTANTTGYYSAISTQATAFTLTLAENYAAYDGTLGAASAITTQVGFSAHNLTRATNNYGFKSSVAAGATSFAYVEDAGAASWFLGEIRTGATAAASARVNYNLAAYGTGTVYTFTNTAAAVVLGTTSPTLTIDKAGTYRIDAQVQMAYAGATVATETATMKLRRTNNTAADITSGSLVVDLPVSTVLTYTYGTVHLPSVYYTTSNTTDVVTIFANVSAGLGAGTITAEAGGTYITATRLY